MTPMLFLLGNPEGRGFLNNYHVVSYHVVAALCRCASDDYLPFHSGVRFS